MKRWAAIPLLLLAACAAATHPDSLQSIAGDAWKYELEHSLALRIKFGLPIEHLPDVTYAQAERDAAFARQLLKRLDTVRPANEDERLTAEILRWESRQTIDALPFFYYRFPVTPYATQLRTVAEAFAQTKNQEALLREMPRFVGGIVAVLREEERRGIRLPKEEIPIVQAMLAGFRQSAFAPALKPLTGVFDSSYVAAAPAAVGLSQYPGGAAAYRYFVSYETTTTLTPEQIHELGLREIARINGELDAIRRQVGFSGTTAEFRKFLKSDSRFFARTPEEVDARLTAYVHRIEPQIPRFFARTPKAAYDVKRLDPRYEGSMTFGYYQPPTATDPAGHYYFNGSKLNERNLLFAAALMLHELIPGHHFQIARQEENTALPMIRREDFHTAFVEGWGEYAASLGNEMKLYDDPYDRAGRLMMDSLLSTRLVVDTGMNALGWPRQRAIDYMRENTMLSDTEIATETLRYAVDIPGQALAYKIGSAKMLELRALAQRELGPRFDIRQFHEWIIGSGSMPLSVLEEHVRAQLAGGRAQ